jgi:hypothetical protein
MNDFAAGFGDGPLAARARSAAWVFDPWFTSWAAADAWVAMHAPAHSWQRRQRMRLHALLEVAAARSAWWRQRLRHARLDAPDSAAVLHSLPRLSKAELMTHFDAAVTDPLVRRASANSARRCCETWPCSPVPLWSATRWACRWPRRAWRIWAERAVSR